MWYIIITRLIIIIGSVQARVWTDPVNTSKGQIRGLLAEDGDYSMYLGIPYAKVDEKNPFGISKPYPKFETVFDAVDDTAICPQLGIRNTSLDCLHLNIYVPNEKQLKLPVLVWIYGGGFTSGFFGRSLYGPKFLVRHNVIFVSLNYRLGPYGFMCLNTEEVPGNQALRDQYLALNWIKENIASFGGDPDKVTLMGESAGSMSIDIFLMSDLPIFYNQAILQSGTGLTPTVVIPSDDTVPVTIAKHLGYTTDDMAEALSYLAKAPTDLVLNATSTLKIPLALCVEKEIPNVKRFISLHPEHCNISHVKNLKIIAGFNSHEQVALLTDTPIEQISEAFFRDYLSIIYDTNDMNSTINILRKFYIGDEKISEDVSWGLIDFKSDFMFNYPIQTSINKYLKSGARVYQYVFSYDGGRNYMKKKLHVEKEHAGHADELGYLFDMALLWEKPTVKDQLMIDRLTTMWTNFAKYGNPTPTASEVVPITWPPASNDMITYLDINTGLSVSNRPYHSRMSFWDLFHIVNQDKLLVNINQPSSSSQFSPLILLYYFLMFAIIFCIF